MKDRSTLFINIKKNNIAVIESKIKVRLFKDS